MDFIPGDCRVPLPITFGGFCLQPFSWCYFLFIAIHLPHRTRVTIPGLLQFCDSHLRNAVTHFHTAPLTSYAGGFPLPLLLSRLLPVVCLVRLLRAITLALRTLYGCPITLRCHGTRPPTLPFYILITHDTNIQHVHFVFRISLTLLHCGHPTPAPVVWFPDLL